MAHKDGRFNDGYVQTTPVTSRPADVSWSGTLGVSGNVFEWVADQLGDYPTEAKSNPVGPPSGCEKSGRDAVGSSTLLIVDVLPASPSTLKRALIMWAFAAQFHWSRRRQLAGYAAERAKDEANV